MSLESLARLQGGAARTMIERILLAGLLLGGCGEKSSENRLTFQVGTVAQARAGHYLAFAIATPSIRSVPVTVTIQNGEGGLYNYADRSDDNNTLVMNRLCCPADTSVSASTLVPLISSGRCLVQLDNDVCAGDLKDTDTRVVDFIASRRRITNGTVMLGFSYPFNDDPNDAGIFYVGSRLVLPPTYTSNLSR